MKYSTTQHLALSFQSPALMLNGGMKKSGYGKDMSMYAIKDYSAVRHVMVKL